MKKLPILLLLMLPLVLPAQRLKLNKGDFEVAGSALFNAGELGGDLRFGAFLQDYVQGGLTLSYHDTDFATRTGIGFYGLYLFESRRYLLPYVGGGLGFSSIDIDGAASESGAEFTLLTGLKYYVADNVSLNTELAFGVSTADTYLGDDELKSTDITLRIGLSYFW